MSVDADTKKARRSGAKETIIVVIHALILAMIVRVFFYQPFNIPSGSMKATLLIMARRITPPGYEARIDLTITDDFPLAQAIVIISGLPLAQSDH